MFSNKIRFSVEAYSLLINLDEDTKKSVAEILRKKIGLIKKEELEEIIKTIKEKQNIEKATVKVIRTYFKPTAKDYEPMLKKETKRDITGKSKTHGKIEDFIKYFRNRFQRFMKFFPSSLMDYTTIYADEVKNFEGKKVRIICMIYEKTISKSGNIIITAEDLTGTFKAIISKNSEIFNEAEELLIDDIVALEGKIRRNFLFVEAIEYPYYPRPSHEVNEERDLTIAYLSDTHFGSRYFNKQAFEKFIRWVRGKGAEKEIAGRLKYIIIAGDIVDGIGIYPTQEKELLIKDIYKQYELFDEYMSLIPDYIEVIVTPGNHDAVRRGEPMPALSKELIKSDVHLLGNPSYVTIEGLRHLLYHGTSLDSYIAAIPRLSYEKPAEAMAELLKRRHLSSLYGFNPIVPEHVDYLTIDPIPDIFHAGHVHKNGYKKYKGTLVINSGTFQNRTDFQVRIGHMPTPGLVYVYRPAKKKLISINFNE